MGLAQILVDLQLSHPTAQLELSLTQTGQGELVAQLSPKLGHGDAICDQLPAHLSHAQLILAGNILFSQVHRGLINADALNEKTKQRVTSCIEAK